MDQLWGADMAETFTTAEGRAFGISLGRIAVDHCPGEFVGIHAASGANRREAPDEMGSPIRQGVSRHCGALDRAGRRAASPCATTTARTICRPTSSARSAVLA